MFAFLPAMCRYVRACGLEEKERRGETDSERKCLSARLTLPIYLFEQGGGGEKRREENAEATQKGEEENLKEPKAS